MGQGYFAHFTDIHVGGPRWAEDKGNPILNKMGNDEMKAGIPRHRKAEDHLLGALDELKELNPQPAFVLVTGDIVALGSEGELRRYRKLIENAPVPLYHTPSNHDLWGDKGRGWERLMGSRRHRFDYAGIRFFLIDEYEPLPGGKEFQWRRRIRPEYLEWVREGLASWPPPRPVILAFHTPVLSWEKDDLWQESTSELLKMLSEHNILAIITGHIHRNLQWTLTMGEKKIRAINTGPLMGQQWTNLPPYYWFPIRPGYRLFCIQGEELHTFWRELGVELQASLIWVGDVHTGGPRPLVRPITIFSPVHLIAQGYEKGKDVHAMEWGLCKPCVSFHTVSWKVLWWQQMRRTFASALWSDWEAEFDPYEVESGDYMLVVRVRSDSMAYDGVPVKVCHRPSAVPAEAEPEQLFAFGLPHEKEEDRN